ncbi:Hint domain-containing protein [uncultured Tateyamaria sp.]|uniref:Hint domain-containing protein n=1 Tax=Tateyamaria sp. 1078 TaxID=3417464 RepID=UPI002638B6B8|nr:Hint domain-containing protein [uncultured Tateyamaria sp.]
MVASLNGIIFDQVYGDNTGGAEFDTDGDGTATQEDEFVSFTNTTGAPIDVSGWQIWSDASGAGAPDGPQDGLYHTFPPGTVIAPGETLYIINEISGTPPAWAQEASEGGTESGAGGTNTNFLSEGDASNSESVALVDPSTGDFLVFNMESSSSDFSEFDGGSTGSNPGLAGFPGSNMIAEIGGASVREDQDAGFSYQYNATTDSYEYNTVYVACFAADTWIDTPDGRRQITHLRPGDLVLTQDNGPQPVSLLLHYCLRLDQPATAHLRPIAIKPGSLGSSLPDRPLTLSPQHRVLRTLPGGQEVLCPAKGLLDHPGIRVKRGLKRIGYFHLLLPRHEVIFANGLPVESLFLGDYGLRRVHPGLRIALEQIWQPDATHAPARPFVGASAMRRIAATSPFPAL